MCWRSSLSTHAMFTLKIIISELLNQFCTRNESPQIYIPIAVVFDTVSATLDSRQEMASLTPMVKDSLIHPFAIDVNNHWNNIVCRCLLVQYGLLP